MIVRYTDTAASEFEEILSYISQRNPSAAIHVAARVAQTIESLARFPDMAQMTNEPGIRRMPVGRYPYLIFYTLDENELVMLHVRHAAREYPRPDQER